MLELSPLLAAIRNRPEGAANDDWVATSDLVASHLRQHVPLANRRASGVFWTSDRLSERVWDVAADTLTRDSVICDPACGAGNLLLPAVRRLESLFGSNVAANAVRGCDIEGEYVTAARERISSHLGVRLSREQFLSADFLSQPKSVVSGASHVVMNPPFITVNRPAHATWAHVRTSAAAVFVAEAIDNLSSDGYVIALLPEVLRSGSSFRRWREHVEQNVRSLSVEKLGRFDPHTNVDVFLLVARVADGQAGLAADTDWWGTSGSKECASRVSDFFHVSVGSVVPHRTPEGAEELPLLSARDAPAWEEIKEVSSSGPAKSRLDQGPLVVVRRTSSPTEPSRIRATLVLDRRPIAIENHLIVLRPKRGDDVICRDLMKRLSDSRTNEFVNDRIRCRHLTVGSVGDIPWWDSSSSSRREDQ